MLTLSHVELVSEFHDKHGFDEGVSMTPPELSPALQEQGSNALKFAAILLKTVSQEWEHGTVARDINNQPSSHDPRLMRAHLIVEEVSELLEALGACDEVETLDALADLDYVTSGTAVAFDLPLEAAFNEVHRSNMTKAVAAGGDKDVRCRKKGDSYDPPQLEVLLREYRTARREAQQ